MSHQSIAIADFAGMIRSELDMDAARKALIDANVAVRLATDRAFDMGRVASSEYMVCDADSFASHGISAA